MSVLVNANETQDAYTFIRDVRATYKILVGCSLIPQKGQFDTGRSKIKKKTLENATNLSTNEGVADQLPLPKISS